MRNVNGEGHAVSVSNDIREPSANHVMLKSVLLLKICIVSILSCVVNTQAAAAVNVGEVFLTRQGNGDDFGRRPSTSSPKCAINGFTYQHGQIIRSGGDPCISCLCVYGNMYCRWAHTKGQLSHCHPYSLSHPTTATGESGDQFTQSTTIRDNVSDNIVLNKPTSYQLPDTDLDSSTSTDNSSGVEMNDREERTRQSAGASSGSTVTDTNASSLSPTLLSTVCVVMGREYYQGEVLPHETGTCLECRCGREGRVTCSPKDCIAQQDDEFHNPGNSNSLDMFDVDIF